MGDPVVLTGITPDWAVPGQYIQVNFAAGSSAGNDTSYPILLIGNKTSAGSATADTVVYGPTTGVQLQTEDDAIALFGTGSELHLMFREVTAVDKTSAIYAIAVAESAGAQATAVVTWTTTATANGSTRVWVDDDFVEVQVTKSDDVTTIAGNVKAAINAKTKWPVTADNSAGVLTITAKNHGPRGNWHRFSASITSGIGTTVDSGTVAYFTSGATADVNTTALTTIAPMRFYWIVSAAEDATQLGALSTQVAQQALPATGIRQRVFAGFNGTQAAAITISTGINAPRVEMVHLEQSDVPPLRMAARLAGIASAFESGQLPRPRHNFSGFGNGAGENAIWSFPAPRSGKVPSPTALNTALKNGLTPIGVNTNGSTYIAKRATTRCLNGASADFRIRDPHKVSICDFFADALQRKFVEQAAGKDISDDPAQGEHVPGPNVYTPKSARAALFGLIDDFNNDDQLQDVAGIKAGVVVARSGNRLLTRTPLEPIDIWDQGLHAIDQVK